MRSGSLVSAVSGHSPLISALCVNPSRSTSPIYLFPRFSDSLPRDWTVPVEAPCQLWVLHIGNAFEEKLDSGATELHLQASACSYHWFNFQKLFGKVFPSRSLSFVFVLNRVLRSGYDWRSGNLDPSFMNPGKGRRPLLPHLINVLKLLL